MSRRCWHTKRLAEEMTIVNKEEIFVTRLRELMSSPPKTSQQALAEYLGKSRQMVTLYCNGSSTPSLEILAKIAKYFHVSADYLLGLPAATAPIDLEAVCEYTGLPESVVIALRDRRDISLKASINDLVVQLVHELLE